MLFLSTQSTEEKYSVPNARLYVQVTNEINRADTTQTSVELRTSPVWNAFESNLKSLSQEIIEHANPREVFLLRWLFWVLLYKLLQALYFYNTMVKGFQPIRVHTCTCIIMFFFHNYFSHLDTRLSSVPEEKLLLCSNARKSFFLALGSWCIRTLKKCTQHSHNLFCKYSWTSTNSHLSTIIITT